LIIAALLQKWDLFFPNIQYFEQKIENCLNSLNNLLDLKLGSVYSSLFSSDGTMSVEENESSNQISNYNKEVLKVSDMIYRLNNIELEIKKIYDQKIIYFIFPIATIVINKLSKNNLADYELINYLLLFINSILGVIFILNIKKVNHFREKIKDYERFS